MLLIHVEDDVFGKASFIKLVHLLESHQFVVLHHGGIWGAAHISVETGAGSGTTMGPHGTLAVASQAQGRAEGLVLRIR